MDLEELPMGERMSLLTAMERPAWAGHWKELNKGIDKNLLFPLKK